MAKRLLFFVLFVVFTACANPDMPPTEDGLPKAEQEIETQEESTKKPTDLELEMAEEQEKEEVDLNKENQQTTEEKETVTKQEPEKEKPTTERNKSVNQQQATDEKTSRMSDYEMKVVDLVNIERQRKGVKPLKADHHVSNVARKKSADMRDQNYFNHHSPTYGSPFEMLSKANIKFSSAGENIAAGQPDPKTVVDAWMNSDGHRKNILSPAFTHLGVGYQKGGSYGTYWTQMFIGR